MTENYEIIRELAAGGMGIVYLARDRTLKRKVALKVLLGRGLTPDELPRFELEARVVARLSHPNVVTIHASGVEAGKPWLAMEFIEGGSLKDRLKREGPPPPEEAARVSLALADALQHAHESAVLHRDIKPHNILLADGDRPLLTDFGLARDLSEARERLTRSGEVMGSPAYMAPEQANGELKNVGPATDIYGLGATLYELLTGRPPFKGKSLLATLAMVLRAPPAPPRQSHPEIPQELEAICLRCLKKRPSERYATAAELATALRTFLSRGPVNSVSAKPLPLLPVGFALMALALALSLLALALPKSTETAAKTPTTTLRGPTTLRGSSGRKAPSEQASDSKKKKRAQLDATAILDGERALRRITRIEAPREQEGASQAWLARYPNHPQTAQALLLHTKARLGYPVLSFTPTGKPIAAVHTPAGLVSCGAIVELRALGGNTLRQWDAVGRVSALASAPSRGLVLARSADSKVLLLDPGRDQPLRSTKSRVREPLQILVNPAETRVAVVGKNAIEVFELPNLEPIVTDVPTLGNEAKFTSGAFIGKSTLAYALKSKARSQIRFWPTLPSTQHHDVPSSTLRIAADPGGEYLAVGDSEGHVALLESKSLKRFERPLGITVDRLIGGRSVTGVAVAQNPGRVVSVTTLATGLSQLAVFDTATGKLLHTIELTGKILRANGLSLSNDQTLAVLVFRDRIEVWRLP
jgi:serine/threonine protein kinase